ncbi:MAG: lysophospholipid acyltransferase family protein [Limisphaerales bacterium]
MGECYACAMKTAGMNFAELSPHVKFVGGEQLLPPRRVVVGIGHFGNFELYARFKDFAPAYECATTYRALRQPALNRLMQSLRERSGCHYFERRTEGPLLRAAMNQPAIILGLLGDQHAGNKGLRLPFFGHDCSTNSAPAVFALRYECELYTAICYRVALAQWRLELGEKISTHENGHPRPIEAIMRDVNRAYEAAVRRDPANWFWVHNRWKPAPVAKAKIEDGI